MKLYKLLPFAMTLSLMSIATSVSSHAQGPAREHPAYMHALSDLRLMRGYLDRLNPSEHIDEESVRAVQEIDAAINAIKGAAIDDHRDLHEHPPIDAHITAHDRFDMARQAGNAAWHDLDHEEDNAFAGGLKHKAMDHIERANHIVDGLIRRYERP